MQPIDDRILELIRDEGNLTPEAIQAFGVTTRNHASRRCRELARYGLLELVSTGLYRLTPAGRAYLDEDLDADTLDASPVEPAAGDGTSGTDAGNADGS
jgi:hypothetical protein